MKKITMLAVVCALYMAHGAYAVELKISALNYSGDKIEVKLAVGDSLPSDIRNYMNKGVPITIEYEVELWKSRAGWIDGLVDRAGITYRVRYDSWEKNYTVISEEKDLVVENLLEKERETSDILKSSGWIHIPFDDPSGKFYIVARLAIKTMSFSNFLEVESWLKGEISGVKKPKLKSTPDKFGEFLFNTALKITGLKNISEEEKSSLFEISNGAMIFVEE